MTRAASKEKVPAPKPEVRDPVRRALDAAPVDDEPRTTAENRAITRARRGPYLSTEEVRRKLAL